MWVPDGAIPLMLLFMQMPHLIAAGKKVEVNEVTFDSAVSDIQWFGKDQRTVLVQTNKGRLYRSTDRGFKWTDITERLTAASSETPVLVDQIVRSQASPTTLLVAGTAGTHFLSTDSGETWRRLRHKARIHTFVFHKNRPKWALMSMWADSCEKKGDERPCNHMLYLTKDLGRTFALVSSYVVQFSWGDQMHKQEDRIYFTHFRKKEGEQPKLHMWSEGVDFAYTETFGKRVVPLVRQGNKFMVTNGYLFVATLKDAVSQTVNLMVSSNGGNAFSAAKLPQDIDERSYTILDTSEGSVMLHVNHGSREPANVGNVYISDKEGVHFTLSLPNNVRGSNGNCEFDKILSLEGVYMANFKDFPRTGDSGSSKDSILGKRAEAAANADDLERAATGTEVERRRQPRAKSKEESVIRTVISFDKGGVWSYLKPPKVDSLGKKIECIPERCWLHLHGITNFQNYAPFYSTENAVGILMGTGNVGPYLRFEPDQTNTYLSRDGGLTWIEAHKGAYIYEFGDHGGLVVMADDIRKTTQVVFSWNEGQSWYDFQLGRAPIEVDNVVTEPNATSTRFLVYGTRGDAGVLYHLNFEALGQPLCKGVWAADSVSSDYETWMPSDGRGTEKCLLGRQVTYTRRKQTSECFNGETFERPVQRKNCACTQENFECEMGFARKVGSVDCKFVDDGSLPAPLRCTSSDFFYADAYRKVSGDSCEGGWEPSKVAVPCPANSRLSTGAVSVLGTICLIGVIMIFVVVVSSSDRCKGVFANIGFESFSNVKYATIGAQLPETAMDSVGATFDTDFAAEEFGDAPQLMAYTGPADTSSHDDLPRGIDTAAPHVPRLQKPPEARRVGLEPDDDDSTDLL
eukprot:CAMPEP_0172861924 /NCGR_PEP_ID=MMETSP1075-20121228/72937_1 /TAXON_ID=2916 /ORGANISM="Ceratium fusus, Strain PA161109" /LENGTH=856 /DNA_ID=CAMNT_0013710117 /DNA_START=111 /DNA_END=2681 /DNA_ORIENTATION=-